MIARPFPVLFFLAALPLVSMAGTVRVSESSEGLEANAPSWHVAISDDGNVAVFATEADNLVPDDHNGESDIFVHDRLADTTVRINLAPDGTDANGSSSYTPPDISGDGRYVVYESSANNLDANVWNHQSHIYVYDRETGQTERVSVNSDGTGGNGYSHSPNISSDGRFVTFVSRADNLVPEDTNSEADVFLHDRQSRKTTRVDVSSEGAEANEGVELYWGWWSVVPVSDDGRFVAFNSPASNLVPGDTNGEEDVFVRDLLLQQTMRISIASDGGQADGLSLLAGMSDDGRYILFLSLATNLALENDKDLGYSPLFIHDRSTHETRPIIETSTDQPFNVWGACISGNGEYVAFIARGSAVLPWARNEAIDVFVQELASGHTYRASMAYGGGETDGGGGGEARCDMPFDGRYVAFSSSATALTPDDNNSVRDVFIADNPAMFRINPGLNGAWFDPQIAGQGFFIDVLPASGLVFLGWSTFDALRPDESVMAQLGGPGQRWLSAQGEYSGNQALLDIRASTGGVFDEAEPVPEAIEVGEMLVEFASCRSGTVTYNIPSIGRNRVIPIQRVALDNAVACELQAGEIETGK